jgi:hypothetical protein
MNVFLEHFTKDNKLRIFHFEYSTSISRSYFILEFTTPSRIHRTVQESVLTEAGTDLERRQYHLDCSQNRVDARLVGVSVPIAMVLREPTRHLKTQVKVLPYFEDLPGISSLIVFRDTMQGKAVRSRRNLLADTYSGLVTASNCAQMCSAKGPE